MYSLYSIAYGTALFLLFVALSALLLRGVKLNYDDFDEEDRDDEGSQLIQNGPEIPLPPGISLPINDYEPEYNKQKELV